MVNKSTQSTKNGIIRARAVLYWIVSILRGNKSKKKINGSLAYNVQCPQCGCKQAALITARDRGTYKLICPNVPKNNGHCTLGSLTLHELVMRFAPTQTRTKWHKARKRQWRKDEWHPIKNRPPRGPSLPPAEPVLGLTDEIGRLRVKRLH